MNSRDLICRLAESLIRSGKVCATAESCTGGMIGAIFTELPGCSAWYTGGVIAYANQVKGDLLDVPTELMAKYGAVSGQVAEAMAKGVLVRLKADLAVAVTGIAGPGGSSPEKPTGMVWLAWATQTGNNVSKLFNFMGNREQVRTAAVREAVRGLIASLDKINNCHG